MGKTIGFGQIEFNAGFDASPKQNKEVSDNDIAVIGMACKFPMSDNPEDFWYVLRNELECIREFPKERKKDVEKYLDYVDFPKEGMHFAKAGYIEEIDKFDYKFFNMTPNEAKVMDPNHRLFLETAWNALEDAGYGGDRLKGSRTGVYVGYKCALSNVYQKYISDTQPNLIPVSIFGNKPPMMASRISYFLDLKGPSMLIDTACSATLVSMHLACKGLRNGECEMALVGSSKLIAIPVEGLEETIGIESDDFRTRTFDDNSNGTCPGEGVAAVLLKPLKKALDDGDNIYAVIKGSAINQDGKSMAIAVPNSDAQADVIANAWLDARVDPETISYIETHGTATKLGDPIEVEGLRRAFGKFTDKKQFCAIGAVKTNIGHLDNSSSIAGFMKTVLSLKNKEIPASINYNVPNRKIDFIDSPVFVNYELKSWKTDGMTRRCGITGVGLNGTNCHVVLEEAPEMEMNEPDAPKHGIFTLTAKTERALKEFIKKYKQLVDKKQKIRYRDLVYTTNTGKGQYEYRIAFSYKDEEDFWSKIKLLNPLCLKSNNDYPGVFYKQLEENNAKESIVEYGSPEELSKAFVSGAHIDWDKFYMHEKRRKVSTPTYPFEPTRCWVEVPSRKNASKLKSIEGIIKSNMLPENMEKELREVYEKCMQYLESCESGDEEPASVVVLKGRETDEYSDTEKAVASIWSDMLGYEELNIKHTLYDLGGDSVLALKIVNRINEKLNTTLKVVDLLKNPTIEDISSIAEGLFEKV